MATLGWSYLFYNTFNVMFDAPAHHFFSVRYITKNIKVPGISMDLHWIFIGSASNLQRMYKQGSSNEGLLKTPRTNGFR